MKTYEFGMIHDGKIAHIRIQDNSIENAKKRVLEIEKAPERAIQYWRVVPSKKLIKQAKAWGY